MGPRGYRWAGLSVCAGILAYSTLARGDASVPGAAAKARSSGGESAHDDIAPRPALGAYASLPAACADLRAKENRCETDEPDSEGTSSNAHCRFECRARTLKHLVKNLPPPIDELVVFASDSWIPDQPSRNHASESDNHEVWLNVAVRAGARWFVAPALNPGPSWNLDGLKLLEATILQPTGAASPPPGVLLRFASNQAASNRDKDEKQSLVVIGVGPSGHPWALGPIVIRDDVGNFPYGDLAETDTRETITTRAFRLDGNALVVEDRMVDTMRPDGSMRKRRTPHRESRYPLVLP